MFLHFGVNTFTDREWGDGHEDPAIFAPAALDARQWARAARAAGFRAMILTAKHHDGFCLWPTKTTAPLGGASPWRSGRGDVVREFVEACRAEGLQAGPLPVAVGSARSRRTATRRATTISTATSSPSCSRRYGHDQRGLVRRRERRGPERHGDRTTTGRASGRRATRLQPKAVMFSDAGPDVRWIGNERGVAGDPNWSTVDPDVGAVPGRRAGAAVIADAAARRSRRLRLAARRDRRLDPPGWFHHPAEDARVKTVEQLVALYFTSVGRNSKLLLNVPPTRDGVLHPIDVERLSGDAAAAGRDVRGQSGASGARGAGARQGRGARSARSTSAASPRSPSPISARTSPTGRSSHDMSSKDARRATGSRSPAARRSAAASSTAFRPSTRAGFVSRSKTRPTRRGRLSWPCSEDSALKAVPQPRRSDRLPTPSTARSASRSRMRSSGRRRSIRCSRRFRGHDCAARVDRRFRNASPAFMARLRIGSSGVLTLCIRRVRV